MESYESARADVPYSPSMLPAYAGDYASRFNNQPHGAIGYSNLNPASGSADLMEARSAHGKPGDSLGSVTRGPVTADIRENDNTNTNFKRFTTEGKGPVTGGDDYNTQRLIAYQASQIQALTQAESAAAIAQVR